MDFVAVLFCSFREACGGRGAARDKRNEAVYGSDVYRPYSARGFSICAVGVDKQREGDLVRMAYRVDDCDGTVAVLSLAAVGGACKGKVCFMILMEGALKFLWNCVENSGILM